MTTALLNDVHLALPEITLLTAACFALLVDLFFPRQGARAVFLIATIGLFLALFESMSFIAVPKTILFGGAFVSDSMAHLMKIFMSLTVFLSLFYGRVYLVTRSIPVGDYTVLALFSTLGMFVLVS